MLRALTGLLSLVLVGCGAAPSAVTPSAVTPSAETPSAVTPSRTGSSSAPRASVAFEPAFTYVLPDGWAVTHDESTKFRLLPAGFTNDDFDAGKTDGINLLNSIRVAKPECDETDTTVGADTDSIAAALVSRPGLIVAKQETSVGGLPGVVLDIRLDQKWTKPGCGGGAPGVGLIHVGDYDQGMSGDTLMRLYLAPIPGSTSHATVGIEVDDITGGTHIDALSKIVSGIEFVQ